MSSVDEDEVEEKEDEDEMEVEELDHEADEEEEEEEECREDGEEEDDEEVTCDDGGETVADADMQLVASATDSARGRLSCWWAAPLNFRSLVVGVAERRQDGAESMPVEQAAPNVSGAPWHAIQMKDDDRLKRYCEGRCSRLQSKRAEENAMPAARSFSTHNG